MAIVPATDLEQRIRLLAYTLRLSVSDAWSHEWTAAVLRQCPPLQPECELRAIFNALKPVRYTLHPRGGDRYQTLRRTVQMGVGDCDQILVAVDTAAHIAGFRVGARVYQMKPGGVWDHVAPIVELPRMGGGVKRPFVMELTDGPGAPPGLACPECSTFDWQIPWDRVATYRDFWFDLK